MRLPLPWLRGPGPERDARTDRFPPGHWRGSGTGIYPTIDDFSYEEEMVFTHTGRPFLVYSSKTWNPQTSAPMHGVERVLEVGDKLLTYEIAMAFGGHDLQNHLKATLERIS